MSIHAMSWAWKQTLPPTEKFILIALCDHANDDDYTCWPSLNYLENKTGFSRPTIWKAIDRLVNNGFLARIGYHGKSGSTLYEVKINATTILSEKQKPEKQHHEYSSGSSLPSQHTDIALELTQQVHYEGPSKIPKPKNELTEQIHHVFEFWKSVMDHPKAILDDKRLKIINKALKLGYTGKDLMEAIFGCTLSKHHMGENDRQTIYDSIELIFRDAGHIDKFIKLTTDFFDKEKQRIEKHPYKAALKNMIELRRNDPEGYHNNLGNAIMWHGIKESDMPPLGPKDIKYQIWLKENDGKIINHSEQKVPELDFISPMLAKSIAARKRREANNELS